MTRPDQHYQQRTRAATRAMRAASPEPDSPHHSSSDPSSPPSRQRSPIRYPTVSDDNDPQMAESASSSPPRVRPRVRTQARMSVGPLPQHQLAPRDPPPRTYEQGEPSRPAPPVVPSGGPMLAPAHRVDPTVRDLRGRLERLTQSFSELQVAHRSLAEFVNGMDRCALAWRDTQAGKLTDVVDRAARDREVCTGRATWMYVLLAMCGMLSVFAFLLTILHHLAA